jgi:hypothetical protein
VSQNPVLFEDELGNILPFSQKEANNQLKRILNSPNSEDFLTWSVFRPLMDVKPLSRWLLPFFQKSFRDRGDFEEKDLNEAVLKFWYGRKSKEFYPPKEHDEWLRKRLKHSEVLRFRERAKVGKRLEGPTEVDLVIETAKILTFIEAKYTADIDCKTSYDPYRDQITRNLDVGSYQAEKGEKRFFFILLTSEYYERSRLFWYRMQEYMKDPGRIKERIPYRSLNFEELSKNIGWVLWRDVIEIWKANKNGFHLSDDDREKVPLIFRHFQEVGLV